jgi:hypothetical protein
MFGRYYYWKQDHYRRRWSDRVDFGLTHNNQAARQAIRNPNIRRYIDVTIIDHDKILSDEATNFFFFHFISYIIIVLAIILRVLLVTRFGCITQSWEMKCEYQNKDKYCRMLHYTLLLMFPILLAKGSNLY